MNINYFLGKEDEKPLDNLVSDGGFVGIFRKIACVGDSLSSGEFEGFRESDGAKLYIDRFDYSWGQYMARAAGCTVYNFSKGGMSTKEYVEVFANNMGYWQRDLAANAYVIALGVNDIGSKNLELGSIKDVCLEDYTKNEKTFTGYYATIIQRYKEIQPDAVFFLVTIPRYVENSTDENDGKKARHREILHELAGIFDNTYVIDLYEHAPVFNKEFKESFFLGHMTPAGYVLFSKMVTSYIDYIIRHNHKSFKTVGLMGFDYDREKMKTL